MLTFCFFSYCMLCATVIVLVGSVLSCVLSGTTRFLLCWLFCIAFCTVSSTQSTRTTASYLLVLGEHEHLCKVISKQVHQVGRPCAKKVCVVVTRAWHSGHAAEVSSPPLSAVGRMCLS